MSKYSNLKINAVDLRENGFSYVYISNKLGVSKSCIRNWTKEIKLTKSQKKNLQSSQTKSASLRLGQIQQNRRDNNNKTRELLQKKGVEDVYNISDPLFFLGLGLYWGEGYKNKTQEVGIVNTDPRILQVSMMWLKNTMVLVQMNTELD